MSNRLHNAIRQFRHNDDNSPDVFHPEKGFVVAYDKDIVDKYVDGMEAQLDEANENVLHNPELVKLRAQLEAVRDAIVIKPHLEFPVGDRDCERVRVYIEIKAAIGEVSDA